MNSFSSIRVIRIVLALAVGFWMAGAGCMLGCDNMAAASAMSPSPAPATASTLVASGEACASMHSHECCAKHGNQRKAVSRVQTSNQRLATAAVAISVDGASNSMMDCPLAVNATAALSKARQDQSAGSLLVAASNRFIPSLHEQASSLASPTRLPNRGHTYLRCCVFLI